MAAKEPTVERRHRESAALARYPQSGMPVLSSWAHAWVDGTFTDFGTDEECLNAIAQALANAEARGLANRDERCLQSDMQRIRERLASEKAWDEGWEAHREYTHGGVTDRPVNPYRLPPKGDDDGR